MTKAAYVVLAYGLLIFIGGMIGFAQAHSNGSLIAGSIFSLLLILSAVMLHRKMVMGYLFSIGLTVLLIAFFGYRFYLTHKMMPAGMMCAISLAVLSTLIFYRLREMKKISMEK